ncbi:MAG: AAA family ATPase [Lachnospiraceae bacterium]|nr:AAA family ATPase [Lachnospiraceae bacterium]
MARTPGIGIQDFEKIIKSNNFYVDKTGFIKEWWETQDEVTLITRPRRFGKTLTINMVERFFSVKYAGRGEVFCGLDIYQEESFRKLQGTFPVIFLSFAEIKESTYTETRKKICQLITMLYDQYRFLLQGDLLSDKEREFFLGVSAEMEDYMASLSIKMLAGFLSRYYGKKVIILLDEYDTPMQEAYTHGYWEQLVMFTRSLFNSTFKTNSYLERAIMTGITRVSKESVFSDLNNLEVVTTTSCKYETSFGFTEEEVFAALDEYGLSDRKQAVKEWYDGFTFGTTEDIYNPWSILNYLEKQRFSTYWANTSSNSLVGKLIREGSADVKIWMEDLMDGKSITAQIDEQIVYDQLDEREDSIWSLLLASGYLKIKHYHIVTAEDMENGGIGGGAEEGDQIYELVLTNREVKVMFRNMIRGWFKNSSSRYNDFIRALLKNDLKAMNAYMNRVALTTFSFFDSGNKPSEQTEPERFYHGFVLGLMVELAGRYVLTSNRESGFGRYDVMLEPLNTSDDAMIMEFKVFDPTEEKTLEDTVRKAHEQIENKNYAAGLLAKGVPEGHIRSYGFAFRGKTVLIG